jgi:hypothetical protein
MLVHYLIPKTTLINLCLTILPPRKLFDLTPQTLLARVRHTSNIRKICLFNKKIILFPTGRCLNNP